ncbi:MAG TPA: DNA starvation/stationary phase protection protein, partial [Anaerolineaceae bacterium]|nr:DNA starvation/stationary phase protection protein [Anaerolineaceae bacterium]
TLFEVQYKEINAISDEISKRARMLGGRPIGSFEEFQKNSRLHQPSEEIPDILELLADHEAIIRFLREDAKKCTEEYEDEGTRDFLVDVLRWHEKMAWMLRAYVEPELVGDEN